MHNVILQYVNVTPSWVLGMMGAQELALILLLVLLFFGGSRIPELARSIGKGLREFKKGFQDDSSSKNGDSDSQSPS